MPINIYQPDVMEVVQVRQQTADVKSVRIRFRDEARARDFHFRVGQFGIFSAFGAGESPFNLCSSSNWQDFIEFCFRRTGRVTEALWNIDEGDIVGFRGPYGNAYPMDKWRGKNLIFIGGGIAMPPIRCAIWYALENREQYGQITIVYGARKVGDLVFRNELDRWAEYENVRVVSCVDPGGETPGWKGEVGFVPAVVERAGISAERGGAGDRPSDHDPVHAAGFEQDGPGGRRHLHEPGEPHEVRRGQVRPLQLRPGLRLQGRPRLHARADQEAAQRPLMSLWSATACRRFSRRDGSCPTRKLPMPAGAILRRTRTSGAAL